MQSSNGRPRGGGSERPAGSQERHTPSAFAAPEGAPYDDPWYDALASGWGESAGDVPVAAVPSARQARDEAATADVYLSVQRSAAFQEVRSRYRRFVIPAVAGFFTWYVGYVVAATTAPGLMARPVAGAVNVAMLAGLGQFLSTFLLTWAYVRHARLRRDRAALELRWDTQELARGARGGVS
ncbi:MULTISPECIES: DUF485 domain-containing protein [unclassified Streptomyces]|uniref:DUF485 domain-containing protein n=1 Tax=unclassified Streptomyces TaxID=2593676 RepID=UPI001F041D3C|nr:MULTISPECIES: DUF485 domain-containing protein [unclassified Streptomyces]MCH0561871.1 DUF485 domain-containing protein [Streptomyces sp. MUM 2J]MCH0568816.1 DUF485 domain-containing protein [Streptomyces sp. MUM 136J]